MDVERFPIEFGHIMMFARAIGDANPTYHDHENAIAPPTFVQSSAQYNPENRNRPGIGEPWRGSGGTATGIPVEPDANPGGGGGLHAEQHYEYHRHPKPGDILTAETKPGEKWEKESKRAGKLLFSESVTEYRDQNGELVVTARSVGVVTEKPVEN